MSISPKDTIQQHAATSTLLVDPSELCESVLKAFESEGYPRSLIGDWSVPIVDAVELIKQIQENPPAQILEVGTFVGFSTILMALCTPDSCIIHTVDPNLPLSTTPTARKPAEHGFDLTPRPQAIAKKIAMKLGVSDRIVFHTGGYSVGQTSDHSSEIVPIIGPEVCKNHGPFDVIFLDGLHDSKSVESDLRLSIQHLSNTGFILMHDMLGLWGTNVQSGTRRMLEDFDEITVKHYAFSDLYLSIGKLTHEPAISQSSYQAPVDDDHLMAIVSMAAKVNDAKSIVLAEPADPRVRQMLNTLGIEITTQSSESSEISRTGSCASLCTGLCIGTLDALSPESGKQLLKAMCEQCDTLIIALTPPGEIGVSTPGCRPFAYWAGQLLDFGFLLSNELETSLDPMSYPFVADPMLNRTHSGLATLRVARKNTERHFSLSPELRENLLEHERFNETASLQSIAMAAQIRHSLDKMLFLSSDRIYSDPIETAALNTISKWTAITNPSAEPHLSNAPLNEALTELLDALNALGAHRLDQS